MSNTLGAIIVEWYFLVIGAILLLLLYVLPEAIYPLRWLWRSAGCLVVGLVLLALLNLGLSFLDLHIALNLFTLLVAGLLRLPGLIMLVLISQWFI